MESGEAEVRVPNGGGSITTSPPRSHLPHLPTELLLPIYSHLPLSSLAALSITCRSLRHSVDEVGWTAWLLRGDDERTKIVRTLPEEQGLSGKERVLRLVTCDEVWQARAVRARQTFFRDLPGIAPAQPANGRQQHRGFKGEWPALPLARLCGRGLLVAMRSLVVLWDGAVLARPAGLCSNEAKPTVYKLFDEAHQQRQQRGEPSGWEEINAFEAIDALSSVSTQGFLVAVGRFHGVFELWRLHQDGKAQLVATYAAGRGEGAKPSTSSVQGLSYLSAQHLLAVGWKDGHVALFQIKADEDKLDMVHRWLMPDVKIWSIHLGLNTTEEAPWLAVGCQGSTPLIIQRDVLSWAKQAAAIAATPAPPPPAPLPSPPPANLIHLLNSSYTSVYALASTRFISYPPTFPPQLLFAGCFNGQIVAIDVSQQACPIVATYRDAYDDSPIYSLALGVAAGSRSIAAGTGRHGCVKLYEHTRDAQELTGGEEGYTLFPPQPSCSSPTYSVVGEHGRLFCAGRERIWEFDARGWAGSAGEGGAKGMGMVVGVGVGWYRHREMVLMRTCEDEEDEVVDEVVGGKDEKKERNWKGRRGRGRRR